MTFNQLIKLLPKVVKYNLKIIFAGKFFWFLPGSTHSET